MSIPLNDGLIQIFDVDHGQCALLTLPTQTGVKRVLIDCGHATNFNGQPWYPGQHLEMLNVSWIDLLIATNYDEDHMSGLPDLLDRGIKIGYILGNPTITSETLSRLKSETGMARGIEALRDQLFLRQTFEWMQISPDIPGLELNYFWNPWPYFEDENNLSLVAHMRVSGFNFLFPGDMETEGFNHMLATCPSFGSAVGRTNVLVASHHGRRSGVCADMFDVYRCNPNLVVISDDYKQYDTQETTGYYARRAKGISWFRNEGTRYVLSTRRDKEIKFSFSRGSCLVW